MKTYQFRVVTRVSEYWEVQAKSKEGAIDSLFSSGEGIEETRDESVLEIEFIEEFDE